jgi:hypothetical protein
MVTTRQQVLEYARLKIGTREATGRNDVEFAADWGITGQAWCFAFVQSCFWYTGGRLPFLGLGCPSGVAYARANGQAVEVGQGDPIPGDIVFFSWDMATWPRDRPGTGDHVGLVESYTGGRLITIEGNTAAYAGAPGYDGVFRRTDRTIDQVVCFWRPPVFTDDDPFAPAAVVEEEDVTDDDRRFIQKVVGDVGNNVRTAVAADTNTLLDQRLAVINARLDAIVVAQQTGGGDVHVDVDKLGAAIGRSLLAGVLKP